MYFSLKKNAKHEFNMCLTYIPTFNFTWKMTTLSICKIQVILKIFNVFIWNNLKKINYIIYAPYVLSHYSISTAHSKILSIRNFFCIGHIFFILWALRVVGYNRCLWFFPQKSYSIFFCWWINWKPLKNQIFYKIWRLSKFLASFHYITSLNWFNFDTKLTFLFGFKSFVAIFSPLTK